MVELGPLADFAEGVPVPIVIGRKAIAVVRWGDEVFAVKNVCPHQNCRLDAGRVRSSVKEGPVVDPSDPLIVCPWHQWAFRLKDGSCTSDPKARIKTYETEVVDGVVSLNPDSSTGAAGQSAGSDSPRAAGR